ncbi:50S ribosomal protein L13 [Spirochaeta isovalerica]|uniref:Large ribosomal subunit protein uL13 n=1 Tax=Spirochaeta isovalerica TaxID=150 RepID=A0A841R7B4_9SPIO|nr:50S ribosomal protein L13 [Spirochaeta isovalerica]MBB6481144.1 large subunit ribosomal protein L13 [Spirochaeta isovalerica]
MKTIFEKPASIERKWYVIDAEGVSLGRVAVKAANILRGKNKPYYTPHQEIGDYVIIVNAEKAAVTGRKKTDKMYYRHSGYLGGLKAETYEKVLAKKPTMPMEKAVRGMLPKGPLGNKLYTNVKIYAGANHPHAAQQPVAVEV